MADLAFPPAVERPTFLARLERAVLIHGKGTGVLRQKLGVYLKTHPRIRSQRLGGWNEGGSGVTIVEIDIGAS